MEAKLKVLVCGSRDFKNRDFLFEIMDIVRKQELRDLGEGEDLEIVEGEAKGADTLARLWAEDRGLKVHKYPAHWEVYGRGAGPIRNREMLVKEHPKLVVAFYTDMLKSVGTKNMVHQASKAKIRVMQFVNPDSSPYDNPDKMEEVKGL